VSYLIDQGVEFEEEYLMDLGFQKVEEPVSSEDDGAESASKGDSSDEDEGGDVSTDDEESDDEG